MNEKLKYLGYSVVFQEVPDEVTLAINISGCPHHCEGCHSQYLWKYEGNYISDDLPALLDQYKDFITCVCFMGGDQNLNELNSLIHTVKKYNFKVALYSGFVNNYEHFISLYHCLDYLKIGPYDKSLGALNQKTTNQRMYRYNSANDTWEDITYRFWKEGDSNAN